MQVTTVSQFEHKKSDCIMAVRAHGRPHACTFIVDVVLLTADLPLLDVDIRNLHQLYGDLDSVLRWSAQHGPIHNEVRCGNCDILMSLQSCKGANFVNSFAWSCRHQKRVTADSFLKALVCC